MALFQHRFPLLRLFSRETHRLPADHVCFRLDCDSDNNFPAENVDRTSEGKYFIYHIAKEDIDGRLCYSYKIVEAKGFDEKILDEGEASAQFHAVGHEDSTVWFEIISPKLGKYGVNVPAFHGWNKHRDIKPNGLPFIMTGMTIHGIGPRQS